MTIVDRCKSVARCAEEAVQWAAGSGEFLGARAAHVTRQAERALDTARALERAASLPAGVGVFGPSQVGKSYLINSLTKGKAETLKVHLGDNSYNFLTQINPPGGGTEATGIVTRFSLQPHPEKVAGFPVRVRLLTVADIVKVIANTYFSDFNAQHLEREDRLDVEDVDAAITLVRNSRPAPGTSPLTEREVDWIRAYLWGQFSHRSTVNLLESSDFWDEVGVNAAALSVDTCAKVFSVIWGRHDVLTNVFLLLARALESVGFAEAVYCAETALIPRENSILVATNLHRIGEDGGTTVDVRTASGKGAQIALPTLSVIVAELQIQLEDKAHTFQDHTDVLDFPGARSRHKWQDVGNTLRNTKDMGEALLRGKVAYLFERFTDDFMLNSLVFCAKPGNQEVTTVSDYLTPWVLSVHGRKPEDRRGQHVGLFVALTFFDERFKEAEGGDMSWHDAVRTAVVDLLNDTSKWVENWTDGAPFDNVFWIRNPAFKARGLMKYDDNGDEVGKLEPARIARYKQDYLSTELVQRHIADADERFEAPFKVGDGGVTYLAERIDRVCTPDLKDRQIAVRLKALIEDLQAELEPFHIEVEGGENAVQKRTQKARQTIRGLMGVFSGNRFGHLLADLGLRHEEVVAALSRLKLPDGQQAAQMTQPPVSLSLAEQMLSHILEPDGVAAPAAAQPAAAQTSGHAAALARRSIDCWTEKVLRLGSQPRRLASYGLSPEDMSHLGEELISGLESQCFKARLAQRLDGVLLSAERPRARIERTASVVTEMIGDYVSHLGQKAMAADKRAKDARGHAVFAPRKAANRLEEQDLTGQDVATQVFSDWCTAYFALVGRNAGSGASAAGNAPENKALGKLLGQIAEQRVGA